MLEAAHSAKSAGVDVVVGYVEPHPRPETAALLRGLEALPTLEISCRDTVLREFDLDAAIRRKPQLVLVDEMAHTNARGCRHTRRYQDIQELLRHGVNVYTTVNVQHVESLNDVVASITGVTVRERVPDKVFDSADHVELVDIEPEALLERLKQGKIYRQEQAQRALGNFFVKENLVALREIALRRTADIVSKAVDSQKTLRQRSDYVTNEHILVCLSSSPSNPKVIRTAGRMAEAFHGKLTALFVETSATRHMSPENRKRLDAHAQLAEELGAHFATVQGDDVPWHVAEFAKASGVSKIVMGRPGAAMRWLFHKPNFLDQLTALAPNLDIYVIPNQLRQPSTLPRPQEGRGRFLRFSWPDTLRCMGFLTGSSAVGWLFYMVGLSEGNVIMAYMMGVLFTSIFTSGLVYGFVAALSSVLLFNFLFTEPRFSLYFYDPAYAATFVIMLLASGIISTLARRLQQQKALAAQRAYRTSLLLETSQKLQGSRDSGEILRETARQLMRLLGRTVLMYPAEGVGLDRLGAPLIVEHPSQPQRDRYDNVQEQAVAQWSFQNRKQAGAGTGTLSGAKCLCLCVRGQDDALGVMAVAADGTPPDAFEKGLLVTVLGECALALDKERIRESKDRVLAQARQETLRANLLRAISHDLRTPLTSISGNAHMLLSSGDKLDEDARQRLYTDMRDDALWLTGLVENILSITRLDQGAGGLALQPELLAELIAEALRHLTPRSRGHELHVELEDDMLMANVDARLVMQVLINLVDNAIKYTPSGSSIHLSARRRGDEVEVSVRDNGEGLSAEAQAHLFDMFFTAHETTSDSRRGLGLGLYLCKSIVAAHGGQISVASNTPCGIIFTFTVPVAKLDHE